MKLSLLFQIPISALVSFVEALEVGYSKHKNPYHNLMHAADVTQTVHYLLYKTGVAVSTGGNTHLCWRASRRWWGWAQDEWMLCEYPISQQTVESFGVFWYVLIIMMESLRVLWVLPWSLWRVLWSVPLFTVESLGVLLNVLLGPSEIENDQLRKNYKS